MKKLRLDLDDLHVDSFAPADAPTASVGTVKANETWEFVRCSAHDDTTNAGDWPYSEATCPDATCASTYATDCWGACNEPSAGGYC